MASSELGSEVLAELQTKGIDTPEEVADFRIPGERRDNATSPTAGDMFDVLGNIQDNRGQYWVSRKRVRHDALRLQLEGQL